MKELIEAMTKELSEKWHLNTEKTIEKSIVFSDIFMSEIFKTVIKAQNLAKADECIDFFSDLWNMPKEDVVSSIILMFSKLHNAFENKESPTEFYEKIYTKKR